MKAIGIMSGTSLDGIDICIVDIVKENEEYKYEIDQFATYPYSKELVEKILDASNIYSSNVQKICSLNFEIGYAYKDAIEKMIYEKNIDMKEVEFIAIHGQTIWHNPNQMDGYVSSTFQIGEPSVLAYYFNKKVISNFRVMDMVANGSGAPLIPFVDYLIYRNRKKNIALQNIGGIGNVCYIKKNATKEDVIAFDTGPGNMLIDGAMKKLYNLPYDDGGKTAMRGKIDDELLKQLLNDSYLKLAYPKSTGREKYNDAFLNWILDEMQKKQYQREDIIATISAYTAYTIVDQYRRFLGDIDEIIVSGGGSHNEFILNILKKELKTKIIVEENQDAFEAFGFAILGHMRLLNQPSNMKIVTGAKKDVCLGNITYPPFKE